MNALEDTRELVTTQDGLPIAAAADRRQLARSVAGLVDDLIYQWPDVEIASIRITEQPFIGPTSNALFREFTVTGRRGPLAPAECPSCHTTAGHPHTDYCQTTDPAQARLDDLRIVTWHQTGPDEAHERWRCHPAKCGWGPKP